MAEESAVSEAPRAVGKGLAHKIGPFPVWGWLLGVGLLGGAIYLIRRGAGGGGPLAALPPMTFGGGTPAGGSGGGGATTTTTNPLNNAQWLNSVVGQVASQLQIPAAEAQLYLEEWLSGLQPSGSASALDIFNKAVQAATQIGGQPPTAPPTANVGSNPYSNQYAWWQSILQFLPAGTSQSVISELNALFSGSTTTVSQEAATALSYAESIVGLGPTPLNFNVQAPTSPTTLQTTIPGLWQSFVAKEQAYWGTQRPLASQLAVDWQNALKQSGLSAADQQKAVQATTFWNYPPDVAVAKVDWSGWYSALRTALGF